MTFFSLKEELQINKKKNTKNKKKRMRIKNVQIKLKTQNGYDVLHLKTEANQVKNLESNGNQFQDNRISEEKK